MHTLLRFGLIVQACARPSMWFWLSLWITSKYPKMKTRSRNVTGETVQHRQSNKRALLTRRFTVYRPKSKTKKKNRYLGSHTSWALVVATVVVEPVVMVMVVAGWWHFRCLLTVIGLFRHLPWWHVTPSHGCSSFLSFFARLRVPMFQCQTVASIFDL